MHFVVGTQYSSFAGRVPNDSDELVEGGGPTLVRVSVCRHRAARAHGVPARAVGRSVGRRQPWVGGLASAGGRVVVSRWGCLPVSDTLAGADRAECLVNASPRTVRL